MATTFPSPSTNETTPTTRRNDSSSLTTIIGVVVVVGAVIIGITTAIIIAAVVLRHRQVKYSLKNLSDRCSYVNYTYVCSIHTAKAQKGREKL